MSFHLVALQEREWEKLLEPAESSCKPSGLSLVSSDDEPAQAPPAKVARRSGGRPQPQPPPAPVPEPPAAIVPAAGLSGASGAGSAATLATFTSFGLHCAVCMSSDIRAELKNHRNSVVN